MFIIKTPPPQAVPFPLTGAAESFIMRETEIEKEFIKSVRSKGGTAIKLVSPSMNGLPDRLVLMPGGHCFFAEIKAPGEKMRPLQLKRMQQIKNLGFDVFCIDSIEKIREVIA